MKVIFNLSKPSTVLPRAGLHNLPENARQLVRQCHAVMCLCSIGSASVAHCQPQRSVINEF